MSVEKSLFGITREIPETDEIDYGDATTDLLADITDCLNPLFERIGLSIVLLETEPAAVEILANNAILQPTKPVHMVVGTPGAVTITLSVTGNLSIGQRLRIIGTDDTKTVTINNSGNVILRSNVTLGLGDNILLMFNSALGSKWVELSRST